MRSRLSGQDLRMQGDEVPHPNRWCRRKTSLTLFRCAAEVVVKVGEVVGGYLRLLSYRRRLIGH